MKPVLNPPRSLVVKAQLYRSHLRARRALEVIISLEARYLLSAIPRDRSVRGVQHQVVTLLHANERRLRQLGHWPSVVKEMVDAEKLRALARLMPALLKSGAIRRTRTGRLTAIMVFSPDGPEKEGAS